MKDNFFVYSVGILAIVGILVCFIGYATNTLPMHTQQQTTAFTTPSAKKKNCKCCSKRVERVKKANKDLLERNPILKTVLTETEHKTQ
ncbi:hypothetical protein C6497_03520 [Candidatus Poribacteria bacterium]|nr:MAG: hypothetical protein C6497_03520 [Candidatus Poribacteria bacterium]